MLKLCALLGTLTLVYAAQNRHSCENRPGITYSPCPAAGNAGTGTRSTGGGPFGELLDCCKLTEYSGSSHVNYEYHRGTWDLVILCAQMATDKTILIKPVRCDDGSCMHGSINGDATFPMTIAMRGSRFQFSSEASFSVKFFATNNVESSCTCGSTCDSGWIQFADYCYKRTGTLSRHGEQDTACSSMNERARLISIHSFEEQRFMRNNLVDNVQNNELWIGMVDSNFVRKEEGRPRHWKWLDCSPYDYHNWHDTEPNNWNLTQGCVRLREDQDFHWNDATCNKQNEGICKYYLPEIPPVGPTTLSCCSAERYYGKERRCYRYEPGQTTITILCATMKTGKTIQVQKYPCNGGGCNMEEITESTVFPKTITADIADDFTFYSDGEYYQVEFLVAKHSDSSCYCSETCASGWETRGDYCYRRTTNSGGFYDMEDECSSLRPGAHLTSVNSWGEYNFLKTEYGTSANGNLWIGLHDITHGNEHEARDWRWLDCSALSFERWRGNQPNNVQNREDCARMIEGNNYRWVDDDCTLQSPGVCKYYLSYIE